MDVPMKQNVNIYIDIFDLIDFYIDKYAQEIEHHTNGYTRAGMLEGLLWICKFGGISDKDLGEERLKKLGIAFYEDSEKFNQ